MGGIQSASGEKISFYIFTWKMNCLVGTAGDMSGPTSNVADAVTGFWAGSCVG